MNDDFFICQECGLSREVVALVRAWAHTDRSAVPTELADALDTFTAAAASALDFDPEGQP